VGLRNRRAAPGRAIERKNKPACCGAKKRSAASKKATARFAARAEVLLGTTPTSKGEWDCYRGRESGETLYEQNADKYSCRLRT